MAHAQDPLKPMQRSRPRLALWGGLILLFFSGCATAGLTERQWNAGYAALKPGLEPVDALTSLGNPREIRPADASIGQPETWIYSRPERVGRATAKTGENDILLPNAKGVITVPLYEDKHVIKIVEYHLFWIDQRLDRWTRTVTD